ncbi:hypothetical protein [Vibrio metschnikovii]|uniref:hypothetical protein n=1 Tax=Vibrio metschnikovii TaxID=28172 RepID=UPI001C304C37|nr:hypothetical protein [Vibrio metschnikovii]
MWQWLKQALAHYDAWCQQMGLTPEQKRSCVAYRAEPARRTERDGSSDSRA